MVGRVVELVSLVGLVDLVELVWGLECPGVSLDHSKG